MGGCPGKLGRLERQKNEVVGAAVSENGRVACVAVRGVIHSVDKGRGLGKRSKSHLSCKSEQQGIGT